MDWEKYCGGAADEDDDVKEFLGILACVTRVDWLALTIHIKSRKPIAWRHAF